MHEDNSEQVRLTRRAEKTLRLTLCEGKPLDELTTRTVQLYNRILHHFQGDWTMKSLQYRCRTHGCVGSANCKQLAINHTTAIIISTLFRRKVQVLCGNKWYKCTPVIRLVLLGTALHGIFAQVAPKNWE